MRRGLPVDSLERQINPALTPYTLGDTLATRSPELFSYGQNLTDCPQPETREARGEIRREARGS
jgi:hypothetical protein